MMSEHQGAADRNRWAENILQEESLGEGEGTRGLVEGGCHVRPLFVSRNRPHWPGWMVRTVLAAMRVVILDAS